MKHKLIAAISKHDIISYYSKSYPKFEDMIEAFIVAVQNVCSYVNLGVHIRTGKEFKNTHPFNTNDYAVIYYNKETNYYNLGKWNNNTLVKHDDYKTYMSTNSIPEFINLLECFINNTSININQNENRLQKQESVGREQSNRRGTSIEIGEVEISITSGRNSYKRKSSYCQD